MKVRLYKMSHGGTRNSEFGTLAEQSEKYGIKKISIRDKKAVGLNCMYLAAFWIGGCY